MLEMPVALGADAVAATPTSSKVARRDWVIPFAVCAAILAVKVAYIRRINVNWDEFLYLSTVHSLIRGELTTAFQSAYTHLFTWLPRVAAGEMDQIITARYLMLGFLVVTVALIVKLASRWATRSSAWLAALCFLAAFPILRHGDAFRADSMLAPLTLAVLVLLTSPKPSQRRVVAAGVCFGVAMALSVKTILLGPVILALELAGKSFSAENRWLSLRSAAVRLVLFGAVAVAVMASAVLLHSLSLPTPTGAEVPDLAIRSARQTILEVPFLPRWDFLQETLRSDKATWILIAVGALVAARLRNGSALACGLALAPLLFYRNAYPYYYVVMLSPACVLAAVAIDAVRNWAARSAKNAVAWVPLAIAAPLVLQAFVGLFVMRNDEQVMQRATIAAVHRIFPEPVPYIDHSGMIASFRKVNFFMSTWGVQGYRARGSGFMREVIERDRPPLLLANRGELDPGSWRFRVLLPEDQELVRRFYVPYWGAIRVAGADLKVPWDASVQAALPFPGRYRLESPVPVLVDGVLRAPGELFDVAGQACTLAIAGAGIGTRTSVRIVWGAAKPAPSEPPPQFPMYTGL